MYNIQNIPFHQMQEVYSKKMLFFNDESREYFDNIQITDINQFLTDIIPVINENVQLERGFLLNLLVQKLPSTMSEKSINLLYSIKTTPLDIPSKAPLLILYSRYKMNDLEKIVHAQPPIRFLPKAAKLIAAPFFNNLILFIDTFAGEKELDLVLICLNKITELRKNILSEFVLYALAENMLETNQSASFLLDLDLPAYEETMQAVFGYYYDYFPLNSKNKPIQVALDNSITMPGSAFDFYELFLERYRESADITRESLEKTFLIFISKTEQLNSFKFENITLKELYAQICDYFQIPQLPLHKDFIDQQFTFNKDIFVSAFSNNPQAYSSDLFDIAAAGFMFGMEHYRGFLTKLVEIDVGLTAKIDELIDREVRFGGDMQMKENIYQIMHIGCQIRYQKSVYSVINSIQNFEESWELMSCGIVFKCFEAFVNNKIQIVQNGDVLFNFIIKCIEFKDKVQLEKLVFILPYVNVNEELISLFQNSKLDFLNRFLHYQNLSVKEFQYLSTQQLIEQKSNNYSEFLIDLVLDKVEAVSLSVEFITQFSQSFDQNYIKFLSTVLRKDSMIILFSSDIFNDEQIAFFVEILGSFNISEKRVNLIQDLYLKAMLILQNNYNYDTFNPELSFLIHGISQNEINDEQFQAFIQVYKQLQPELKCIPKLTEQQTQELISFSNLQNSLVILSEAENYNLQTDKLDQLSINDIQNEKIVIILGSLALQQKIDPNILARICLEGITSNNEFGLSLACQIQAGSVDSDLRRKVYQSVQNLLENGDVEVRDKCRRVRVCWMEQ